MIFIFLANPQVQSLAACVGAVSARQGSWHTALQDQQQAADGHRQRPQPCP